MDRVAAVVLAGGRGGDFGPLAEHRTKAAFPVAGFYRIIDFVLSNLSHSGVRQVGVVIQFLPASLMEHIGAGRPWDFDMADRRLRFMTPFVGVRETRWFRGTADAIAKNLNLISGPAFEDVLIVSGDHVYRMDYTPLLQHHRATGADLTLAAVRIPPPRQHPRFGNILADADGRVQAFIEKPQQAASDLVSMGIYCFRRDVLLDLIREEAPRRADAEFSLAGDIVQPHAGRLRSQAWVFDGPWYYLGDLREYFEFHMDVAAGRIRLFDRAWRIMTNHADRSLGSRMPAHFAHGAHAERALVSPGCTIEGRVSHSVLSPGVRVGPGAQVERCVIFHDVRIGRDCRLRDAVIDKDVVIEDGACIDGDADGAGLVVVPKGCRIEAGRTVRPGAALDAPSFF